MSTTGLPSAKIRRIAKLSWEGVAQPKWCINIGRTWWAVATLSADSQGPHHSRERQDQAQKSAYGLALGGDLVLGMLSLEAMVGCRYLFWLRWAAASDRMDPFLALVPKFLRADAVSVDGVKMEM
jgi:hypothetical protein